MAGERQIYLFKETKYLIYNTKEIVSNVAMKERHQSN